MVSTYLASNGSFYSPSWPSYSFWPIEKKQVMSRCRLGFEVSDRLTREGSNWTDPGVEENIVADILRGLCGSRYKGRSDYTKLRHAQRRRLDSKSEKDWRWVMT